MTDVERIYQDYHDKVLSYLRSRLTSREDAEDLCSEVFVKVFNKLGQFDQDKASLSTWIYTITRNTLTDHFRKLRPSEELPEELPSDERVEQGILREETLNELAEALSRLDQESRDIIVLRYSNGLTLTEVGQRLNISYGMIKIKHKKALETLKQYMSI